jgi:soluble lytic murein transglycosylase-like protein
MEPGNYKEFFLRLIQYIKYGKVIRPSIRSGVVLIGTPLVLIYISGVLTVSTLYREARSEVLELNTELQVKNSTINNLATSVNYLKDSAHKYVNSRAYKIEKVYQASGIRLPNNLKEHHIDLMISTANYYKIPWNIYFRLGAKESFYFTKYQTSSKGAMYYFQIIPTTFNIYAKRLKIKEHTVESNIRVSGLILADLYSKYKNWSLVVAAYNAGPGNVSNGIPNFKETINHVKFITYYTPEHAIN